MRRNILSAFATASIALVFATSSVVAANPHFVPSAFTGTVTPQIGDLELGYQVAGLGPNGNGWIVAKGWFRLTCEKGGILDTKSWTRRIVEHDTYADESGNYKGDDTLNSGPCKTGWTWVQTDWTCVDLSLYANKGKKTRLDYHRYDYSDPASPKCD